MTFVWSGVHVSPCALFGGHANMLFVGSVNARLLGCLLFIDVSLVVLL